MKSTATPDFHRLYEALPKSIRKRATKAYLLFVDQPDHPSLHFEKIVNSNTIYSAWVSKRYRVIGELQNDGVMVWFWIGSHADYDRLLKSLPKEGRENH